MTTDKKFNTGNIILQNNYQYVIILNETGKTKNPTNKKETIK